MQCHSCLTGILLQVLHGGRIVVRAIHQVPDVRPLYVSPFFYVFYIRCQRSTEGLQTGVTVAAPTFSVRHHKIRGASAGRAHCARCVANDNRNIKLGEKAPQDCYGYSSRDSPVKKRPWRRLRIVRTAIGKKKLDEPCAPGLSLH